MAIFGYKIFDRIIYECCAAWKSDSRWDDAKRKQGIIRNHFKCEMVNLGSNPVKTLDPTILRRPDGKVVQDPDNDPVDAKYMKELLDITPFSHFGTGNVERRLDNFKNALFLAFMIRIRDQLLEEEIAIGKKLKVKRKPIIELEKKLADGTITESEKRKLIKLTKEYKALDGSTIDDRLSEERILNKKEFFQKLSASEKKKQNTLRKEIKKLKKIREKELRLKSKITATVVMEVGDRAIHNDDDFPRTSSGAEVDTNISVTDNNEGDLSGLGSLFGDATYTLYCG